MFMSYTINVHHLVGCQLAVCYSSLMAAVNILISDTKGPGSTPRHGSLELDTGYHPFGVGEM